MNEAPSEAQLTHAQAMEVIGLMAGGVAHDFNNLLAVILGQAEFLLNEALTPGQRKRAEAIHRAGERGIALTRKLLALSRREVIQPRILDLNMLIIDLAKMLRRLIPENIQLLSKLDTDRAIVRADPGHIEQVIINLAVNARDAMPQGGEFAMQTAIAGELVRLTLSDTGVGMSEEAKAHLFEPFFTTKAPGKGTGLGLATVQRIVKQSGGEITCESELGQGTTFTISLPRIQAAAPPEPERWFYGKLPSGTETVLLVEDDADIRDLARELLTQQGYTVLDAADADAALQLSRNHSGPIHLLLTDVVLPSINGRKLAEQLAASRPEIEILYMSGHTDDVILHSGVLHGRLPFLRKPFTPLGLARKVRLVLDARSSIRNERGE